MMLNDGPFCCDESSFGCDGFAGGMEPLMVFAGFGIAAVWVLRPFDGSAVGCDGFAVGCGGFAVGCGGFSFCCDRCFQSVSPKSRKPLTRRYRAIPASSRPSPM